MAQLFSLGHMSTPSHSQTAIFCAKLAASRSFLIAGLIASVALGGGIAGLFAIQFGYIAALIVVGVAGLVASHFAYRQLEIHFSVLCALAIPAFYAQKISLWLFSIPGVVTGFLALVAVMQIMDRPNQEAAILEYKKKHEIKTDDVA